MRDRTFNPQAWPRDERDLWIADDEDSVLLNADYRQIEAALTAFFARDFEQMELIQQGANMHAMSAANFYGCEPNEKSAKAMKVMKSGREETAYQATKEFRHGRNFWMGWSTLSKRFGFTAKEAKRLILADDKRWPAVARWRPATAWQLYREGKLVNPFGRPIYSHSTFRGTDIEKWGDAREAIAFLPQSTAGDIFKLALARLSLPKGILWGAAHDSITLHVPVGETLKWARVLRDAMVAPWPEMVLKPFYPEGFVNKVDITVGYSWGGKESVEGI